MIVDYCNEVIAKTIEEKSEHGSEYTYLKCAPISTWAFSAMANLDDIGRCDLVKSLKFHANQNLPINHFCNFSSLYEGGGLTLHKRSTVSVGWSAIGYKILDSHTLKTSTKNRGYMKVIHAPSGRVLPAFVMKNLAYLNLKKKIEKIYYRRKQEFIDRDCPKRVEVTKLMYFYCKMFGVSHSYSSYLYYRLDNNGSVDQSYSDRLLTPKEFCDPEYFGLVKYEEYLNKKYMLYLDLLSNTSTTIIHKPSENCPRLDTLRGNHGILPIWYSRSKIPCTVSIGNYVDKDTVLKNNVDYLEQVKYMPSPYVFKMLEKFKDVNPEIPKSQLVFLYVMFKIKEKLDDKFKFASHGHVLDQLNISIGRDSVFANYYNFTREDYADLSNSIDCIAQKCISDKNYIFRLKKFLSEIGIKIDLRKTSTFINAFNQASPALALVSGVKKNLYEVMSTI